MRDFTPPRAALHFSCPRHGPAPAGLPAMSIEASQYIEMEASFRSRRGLASSERVTELLRRYEDQPVSRLARWIVDRDVLSVEWSSRLMLPLFQFDPASMLPRLEVREVIRELAPVLGDWSLTLWFARPHALLGGAVPVDAIDSDPEAVFDAARAERFLVRG